MTAEIIPLHEKEVDERDWKRVSHNLVLHIPSGIYYVRKSKAGRGRLFKTTELKKKGQAQTKADEMVAKWLGGQIRAGRRYRIETLCEMLDEALEKEANTKGSDGQPLRRARTRENDQVNFKFLKKHFGDVFADEIDEEYWSTWCLEKGLKLNRTLGDVAKYMSKVLTYAHRNKIINRKPEIKNPDSGRIKTPENLSDEEIRWLWDHACQTIKDLLVLGAESGIRPNENLCLEWDWIEIPKTGPARLAIPDYAEKRSKGRTVLLSDNSTAVLRRRNKERTSKFVFPAPSDPSKPINRVRVNRYWHRAYSAANLARGKAKLPLFKRKLFRWLRHTFFTKALLEAKKELPKVAAYGGNSPKVLFENYLAKDADKTKDMADVVSLNLEKNPN